MNSVPPCASSSAPTLRLLRAVAGFDAEQLDLHALRRDRGGVDDHERAVGARRMAREWCARRAPCRAPDGPTIRMRLLVGATFSMVWRSWFIGRRPADQRRRQRRELLELLHLALEPRVLQRALGDQHQPVGLERLLDEVVGAALDGGDRGLDIAVAGDHHHRQFGMFLLERVEQLQAVEPAALQPDVEKNQVGPARDDRGQRVVAVARGARARSPRPAGCRRPVRGYRLRRRRSGFRMPWSRLLALLASIALGRRSAATGSAAKRKRIQAPRSPGDLFRRIVQLDARRHALRECARRWRGRGRCPSRASSRRARAAGCGFPSAGRCRCRSRR